MALPQQRRPAGRPACPPLACRASAGVPPSEPAPDCRAADSRSACSRRRSTSLGDSRGYCLDIPRFEESLND